MHKTLNTLEPAAGSVTDAAALHALYARTMDGWNQGSGPAFAASWAADGHLIGFDGTHFTSREEIARFHEDLLRTHLQGTRLVGRVTGVTFPAPDVAVLHARGGTIMAGGSEPAPERDPIQTLVAVRSDDGWRLVAFQNTRVRPMGRDLAGILWWLIADWVWKLLARARAAMAGGDR
jgi:uncharacterized protein (TIGR02246 family)